MGPRGSLGGAVDTNESEGNRPAEPSQAEEPPVRFRGDEADLYLAHNHELVKKLSAHIRGGAPQDIEDAAAFAWIQFFRYQPTGSASGRAGCSAPPNARPGG